VITGAYSVTDSSVWLAGVQLSEATVKLIALRLGQDGVPLGVQLGFVFELKIDWIL
jgi:hypothetical protein